MSGRGEWHGGKKGRGFRDEDDYKPPRISPHEPVWRAFDDVVCMRATSSDKMLLMALGDEDVWIPRNQISESSEVYEVEHEGKLIVSEWIVETRQKEGKLIADGEEVSHE